MINQELKTVFPIYDSLQKQNRFVKYTGAFEYKLITPNDSVLPFQFYVPGRIVNISSWRIYFLNNTVAFDISANIGLIKKTIAANSSYIWYNFSNLGINMPEGYYYMKIVVNGVDYFSEVFFAPCVPFSWSASSVPYTKIEIDNLACDLGPIMYQTGFKQVFYTEENIIKEAPIIEEEGNEDENKDFIPTIQKYVDVFVLEELCPLYLVEALTLAAMHKSVYLTTKNSLYRGQIKNIKPSTAQNEVTENYLLTLSFRQSTVYVATNCCTNIELFNPCGGAIATTSATAQNNATGDITVNWTLTGTCDIIRIVDVSVTGACSLAPNRDVLNPALGTINIPGYTNGIHNIMVVPICVLGGQEYTGVSKTISLSVSGSTLC